MIIKEEKIKQLNAEIESIQKEIEVLKKYKSDKWYLGDYMGTPFIVRFNGYVDKNKFCYSLGIFKDTTHPTNKVFCNQNNWCDLDYVKRLATEEEIREFLESEAIRRGFDNGIKLRYAWYENTDSDDIYEVKFTSDKDTKYNINNDSFIYKNVMIYNNIVWAEIVNSDEIIVGKHKVIKHDNNSVSIDNVIFDKEFWQHAKKISKYYSAKVLVGQAELERETIEKIINKFNL